MYYSLCFIYQKKRSNIIVDINGLYCILLGFSYRNIVKVFSRFVNEAVLLSRNGFKNSDPKDII